MALDSMSYLSVWCTFSNPILEVRNFETSIFWDASGQPLRAVLNQKMKSPKSALHRVLGHL